MTQDQYQKALTIIIRFLRSKGYDVQQVQMGVEDGHWMLWWIANKANCCPAARGESLVQLLIRLEQGCHIKGYTLQPAASNWLRCDSIRVLQAAGIPEKRLLQRMNEP